MGKGKSSPGVQWLCPAQHLCSQQHCKPGGCLAPEGFPRKGHFCVDFQEKSHSLPAEELKCRNGCSQHSPPVAHVGAAPRVCLPALPKNSPTARGAWIRQGQAGTQPAQGRVKPLLALSPHQHPFFHVGSHSLCALQQNWDKSQGAALGGLSPTSHPAWLGNSLPRQRNPHFITH